MANNFGTLNRTTRTTSEDLFLLRQSGIDYAQTREILAAGVANARWSSLANYTVGTEVLGSNHLPYKAVVASGPDNAGAHDPTTGGNNSPWMLDIPSVSPLNNDWNGFFDPEHQEQLPSPNGYPSDSSSGGSVYAANDQWSFNCFSSTTANTISSDVDGVIFSGSIEKRYEFTPEQIVTFGEDKIVVYIKDQDGKEYLFKNGDTGVTVSIVGTTITVTLSSEIFTIAGLTKVWRFFVTERVGSVVELSVDSLLRLMPRRKVDVTATRALGVTYTNTTPNTRVVYFAGLSQSITNFNIIATLDSTIVARTDIPSTVEAAVSFTVPPFSNYQISNADGVETFTWSEY